MPEGRHEVAWAFSSECMALCSDLPAALAQAAVTGLTSLSRHPDAALQL